MRVVGTDNLLKQLEHQFKEAESEEWTDESDEWKYGFLEGYRDCWSDAWNIAKYDSFEVASRITAEYICEKLSEILDNPCDYSFEGIDVADVMTADGWCEKNCDTHYEKCWKRLFEILADKDGVEYEDMVPVVRCADCKYMDDSAPEYDWSGVCQYWKNSTDYSWFCAVGEKKEDE